MLGIYFQTKMQSRILALIYFKHRNFCLNWEPGLSVQMMKKGKFIQKRLRAATLPWWWLSKLSPEPACHMPWTMGAANAEHLTQKKLGRLLYIGIFPSRSFLTKNRSITLTKNRSITWILLGQTDWPRWMFLFITIQIKNNWRRSKKVFWQII